MSLSLYELSLLKPSSILRIFAEKRHVQLVHNLRSPSRRSCSQKRQPQPQQQQQQQQGLHTLWEVAARYLGISEGIKSALVWKCLFSFCLAHCDWRGVALCVAELPLQPTVTCDPLGRLKLATAAASSSSSSSSKGKVKRLALLQRILSFLRRRREGGESVFLDELLLQQLARRGLFLEAPTAAAAAAAEAAGTEHDDTVLALLLQRHAKAGRLFRKQQSLPPQQQQRQQQQQPQLEAAAEMLPVGSLSPLHLFVMQLCLSNTLPSLLLSYLEHFCLGNDFEAQQLLKASIRARSNNSSSCSSSSTSSNGSSTLHWVTVALLGRLGNHALAAAGMHQAAAQLYPRGDSFVCKDSEGTPFLPVSAVSRLSPPMLVSLLAFIPQPPAAAAATAAAATTAAAAAAAADPRGGSEGQEHLFSVSPADLRFGLAPFRELSRAYFVDCMQQQQQQQTQDLVQQQQEGKTRFQEKPAVLKTCLFAASVLEQQRRIRHYQSFGGQGQQQQQAQQQQNPSWFLMDMQTWRKDLSLLNLLSECFRSLDVGSLLEPVEVFAAAAAAAAAAAGSGGGADSFSATGCVTLGAAVTGAAAVANGLEQQGSAAETAAATAAEAKALPLAVRQSFLNGQAFTSLLQRVHGPKPTTAAALDSSCRSSTSEGFSVAYFLSQGRPSAAFHLLLASRSSCRCCCSRRSSSRSSTCPAAEGNTFSEGLLLPLDPEQADLLQETAVHVALCNLLDEGVVSSCLLFLELCGIDATILRVDAQSARRIYEHQKQQQQQQRQNSAAEATNRRAAVPGDDAAAATVIQLFRGFPRPSSKSGSSSSSASSSSRSGRGISSPDLLSALRLLEEATWALSAPPEKAASGNAAAATAAIKRQATNPAHELPHSLTLLHELARKGHWLSVLHEAELQRCPKDTLRGVIEGYFTDPCLRGHLKRAIGCSSNSRSAAAAPESFWGNSDPLYLLVAARQKQQQRQLGLQLLREALRLRRPRLAVYASCFSDCSLLQCLSIWLALQAALLLPQHHHHQKQQQQQQQQQLAGLLRQSGLQRMQVHGAVLPTQQQHQEMLPRLLQLVQTGAAAAASAAGAAARDECILVSATAETLWGLVLSLGEAGCFVLLLRGFSLFDPKSPLMHVLHFLR
ncbi:hypothetical protein ETH_00017330 [Eimeria tenella]|uniref:Spatacsin C-terminal domain-containing protein n=1 Tax=Eimeria tenella TaxID=5802 RepID=U6KXJ8_EIMTE|nr:hypothetical protein ETH_00017330 [Eimeria tenella]CDJ42882.1 hypothetical protein ETH_00017330 [Eimeria tenella]|eukprot:XP_013233632.1 hypothetical protein ETH_00017330 [Eimeria tenella]